MEHTSGNQTGMNGVENARTVHDTIQGVLYLLMCLTGVYTLQWNWNAEGFAAMLMAWFVCGVLVLVSKTIERALA